MAEGPSSGLRLLVSLAEELAAYAPFYLARADMFRRMGRMGPAREAIRAALDLTQNRVERDFIVERLKWLAERE